jgi:hypothetical protein
MDLLKVIQPQPTKAAGGRRRAKAAAADAGPPPPILATECPNCFTCPIDATKLQQVRHATEGLKPTGSPGGLAFKRKRWTFHAESPTWKSDIRWVSSADPATFRTCFEPLFEKLQIAQLFRFLGEMTLFSGFVVVRQHTRKSHFHTDFGDTGARAYTLMTPCYDMSDLADCHLVCHAGRADAAADAVAAAPAPAPAPAAEAAAEASDEARGHDAADAPAPQSGPRVVQYRYRLGEAVVFGDGFVHATQTGSSPRPLAFLCFTFGDRRLTSEQWAAAEGYIKEQGPVYQDPSGRLIDQRACAPPSRAGDEAAAPKPKRKP